MGLLNKFKKSEKRADYKEEIIEHIADLLNTKRNLGTYPKDYGMDSYVYLGSDKKVALQIMDDIQHVLEKYESRIHDIEIQPLKSENSFFLSFLIKFKIQRISYSAQLSFNGSNKLFNLEVAS